MSIAAPRPEHQEHHRRPPVFVHDFVPLDVDLTTAAAHLGQLLADGIMARLVAAASNREIGPMAELGPLDPPRPALGPPVQPVDVTVQVGVVRWRDDAMIVPLSWSGQPADWVVPLEADLELAAYGLRSCHLHILGRSKLSEGMMAFTQEASLYNRVAVAVVRRVLSGLAGEILQRTEFGAFRPSYRPPSHSPGPDQPSRLATDEPTDPGPEDPAPDGEHYREERGGPT